MKTLLQGVQNLHLASGEDVIGTVNYDDENDVFYVEKPCIPRIVPSENGMSVQLMPFRPWLENNRELPFNGAQVTFCVPVDPKLGQIYTRQFSVIDIVPGNANLDNFASKITL